MLTFSDKDPISRGWERGLKKIPGTIDQPHTTIKDGGHFLQEDKSEKLCEHIIDFIQ